ncbi:MAG: alpha/beta fold hydrolase [Dehalococcoidia bacterium]|nr:alpha/beta fold hydrolase [Dehalococcoidia bacterium]MSQ16436.1 alpha/beta fold hydrolase [Dehalococcoidia bacterium]
MKVRLDDGAELFYRVDDFTDPWTKPETVVLHHGMAKNHKLWYAWIPIIARHYRVVRYDMRGMGQSSVPPQGYSWSLENYAKDLLGVLDKLELDRVHLIGETVGGTISMKFATLHQERLRSLTVCTSPTNFPKEDGDRAHNVHQLETEGTASWVASTISRRLDPQIVDPAYTRWYAEQMSVTSPHVVAAFSRYAPGVDLRPALKTVRTPTLVLAAANLQGEVLGDFRDASKVVPNGRQVVFPGVTGFIQHILPVPCARVWLDFVKSLPA